MYKMIEPHDLQFHIWIIANIDLVKQPLEIAGDPCGLVVTTTEIWINIGSVNARRHQTITWTVLCQNGQGCTALWTHFSPIQPSGCVFKCPTYCCLILLFIFSYSLGNISKYLRIYPLFSVMFVKILIFRSSLWDVPRGLQFWRQQNHAKY